MNLFDSIGKERLYRVIEKFYAQAINDPMLAHFFMDKDHATLVSRQVSFVTALLGGPQEYRGRPLAAIHQPLRIRKPHFMRRQRILFETMVEEEIPDEMAKEWLRREEEFAPVILEKKEGSSTCHHE